MANAQPHCRHQLKTINHQLPQPDERIQTGILTSGVSSLPPSRSDDQWPVGVCSPLQWRNRPGFSPGSLTFDFILADTRPPVSKSADGLRPARNFGKNFSAQYRWPAGSNPGEGECPFPRRENSQSPDAADDVLDAPENADSLHTVCLWSIDLPACASLE